MCIPGQKLTSVLPSLAAICCPSRVTLWTGQLAHNTNVTNVNPPWGESSVAFIPDIRMMSFQYLIQDRRVPQVRPEWIQRPPSRPLAAAVWLQHLLRRQALQLTHHPQLRLASSEGIHPVKLLSRSVHISVLQCQHHEKRGAAHQSCRQVLDRYCR